MHKTIPLYVIHGQLGAGKTTVLTSLLRRPEFANARIVENEFAAHGIDGGRLHEDHPHLNIYEISGTCVCCTGSESLMHTLLTLADATEERMPVVVETTGAADAARFLRTLLLDPEFHERFTLAANILVIDALALHHDPSRIERYRSDIVLADLVILTKIDLLAESDARTVENIVANIVQGKKIMLAEQGVLPVDISFAEAHSGAGDALVALSDTEIERDHEGIMWRAVTVPLMAPSEFIELLNSAKANGTDILRIKGVLNDKNGQAWQIDGTEHASEFHRLEKDGADAVIVLIGRNIPDELPV
jgi:G3E family GTPase